MNEVFWNSDNFVGVASFRNLLGITFCGLVIPLFFQMTKKRRRLEEEPKVAIMTANGSTIRKSAGSFLAESKLRCRKKQRKKRKQRKQRNGKKREGGGVADFSKSIIDAFLEETDSKKRLARIVAKAKSETDQCSWFGSRGFFFGKSVCSDLISSD